MPWLHFVSWFFGGMFAANAVPHFVNGISGRPFQSPFASPPRQGAFLVHGQRPLGRIQRPRRLLPHLPRRRF